MFSRASERYGFRQQQTPPCLTALSTARCILADISPPATQQSNGLKVKSGQEARYPKGCPVTKLTLLLLLTNGGSKEKTLSPRHELTTDLALE